MLTIINNETDVLYNLALEEYVLKHLNIDEDILLIWQNKKSVVIGKDQIPFRDLNYPYVQKSKLAVYRRLTNGEPIYNDRGTINFSIIVSNLIENRNNYRLFLEPIIDLLKEYGIDSDIDFEGNLVVEDNRFSLNTQIINKTKMVHHGVIYYKTNLDNLNKVLQSPPPNEFEFNKKIIKHRPVSNLNDYFVEKITAKQFIKKLHEKFIGENVKDSRYVLDYIDKTKIHKIVKEKYETWEWIYGESPEFIIKKEFEDRMMITLMIKQGIIVRVSIDSYENVIELIRCLEGCKFNEKALKERLVTCNRIDINKLLESLFS